MKRTGIFKKKKNLIIGVLIILFILYWLLVNVLVSACLVPSFMDKLEAFERITEKSYSEQVQTDDIKDNRKESLSDSQAWAKSAEGRYLKATSSDGYELIAREFFAEDEDSHDWVILLHGYTGWKEEMYPNAYEYSKRGYHIIVPDLRCQGQSDGDFIGMGLTDSEDCMIYVNFILKEDPEANIVIQGQSMGAATALMMSGREDFPDNVIAIISDAAYTDAYSMFSDKIKEWFHLPAFPLVDSACIALKFRGGYELKDASAIEAVRKSNTPTLFIHGTDDKLISCDMAYELYEAENAEKELLIVEGAGHVQSQDKDPEKYYKSIFDFIEKQKD